MFKLAVDQKYEFTLNFVTAALTSSSRFDILLKPNRSFHLAEGTCTLVCPRVKGLLVYLLCFASWAGFSEELSSASSTSAGGYAFSRALLRNCEIYEICETWDRMDLDRCWLLSVGSLTSEQLRGWGILPERWNVNGCKFSSGSMLAT
jgi:hypothetical protein